MGNQTTQRIQRTVTFPAKYESLEAISDFIRNICKLAGMDDTATYQVELSIDEACSNIIEHAYFDAPDGAKIECKCTITEHELRIQLHDHGNAFNPLNVPAPDITASLEERAIGGLGIFIMRHYMDKVIFRKGHFPGSRHPNGEDGNYLILVKSKRAK
jgi:serine/threonine-protein kinase RsbW